MSIAIRPALVADAPRITQIYVNSWNAGFGELMPTIVLDDARIARWADDLTRGTWWVAELNGVIAGFTGICPSRDPVDPQLGELDSIAVDPPYWRTGVGTALMHTAVEALAADYPEAILWTLANYPQGQRFYESTGWHPDGQSRADGNQLSYRRTFGRGRPVVG